MSVYEELQPGAAPSGVISKSGHPEFPGHQVEQILNRILNKPRNRVLNKTLNNILKPSQQNAELQ